MRKKQSVTQRVVIDEDGPIIRDEAQEETDNSNVAADDQEDDSTDNSVSKSAVNESQDSQNVDATSAVDDSAVKLPKLSAASSKSVPGKESRSESIDQPNLFDEDGNAILPDGTLIIQPTDVDGDRPNSGPVTAPSEGASLQFDFKDGNPDPKYILSSQSTGSGGTSSGGPAPEPGVLDVVKCTTCTTKLNPYHKDDLSVHPVLKVITCKRCMRWYNSVDWSKDEDGKDNQCRWCGEGGQLICCDVCHNTFCKTCIKRNLGRSVLQEIEDLPEDALWRCYVCDQGPLLPLQQGCAQILEKVEAYRMGKLQRKFKVQNAKKQVENKKPPATPTTVTVPVTPVPGLRPQIGVRMTSSSVTPSGMMGPRSSVSVTPSNPTRGQFTSRLVPPMTRGPRLPMPMLLNSGMNRPMQSNQARYPGSQMGRPPTAVRGMRPGVRPPMNIGQNRGPQGSMNLNTVAAGAAGSNAATEEWYEQNCSLREILREVNSVDPSNIELALKTTLKELQSWTRKCNHLENELRGALNDAQRRTVVHKFKSTFRLNLLLRLGKIHTLMQKESGLQMAVAAQRSAVMAVQAQSQNRPNLPGSMMNANAKKLMVPTNRPMVPSIRGMQPGRLSGGVIDLTEDNSASANKMALGSAALASQTSRLANLGRPPQLPNSTPTPTNNTFTSSSSVAPGRVAKVRRSINSTHVNLLSSDEEEEEEKDDGMIDDRSDKTWSGCVTSRSAGLRRKSARLAAKSVSLTEGSENENESLQGTDDRIEESDDSQSRLLVRLPIGKRVRRRKSSGEDEERKAEGGGEIEKEDGERKEKRMKNDDDDEDDEDIESSAKRDDGNGSHNADDEDEDASPTKFKPKEADTEATEGKSKKPVDKVNHNEIKEENGKTTIMSNGINNMEDSNSQDKMEASVEHAFEEKEDNSAEACLKDEVDGETESPKEEGAEVSISKELEEELLNETTESANDSAANINDSLNDKDHNTASTKNDTCITVSMWEPSDEGSDNGDTNGLKRKSSVHELQGEDAKRQKLDE